MATETLPMYKCRICGVIFHQGSRTVYCRDCLSYVPTKGVEKMSLDEMAALKKLRERQRYRDLMKHEAFREKERQRSRERYWRKKNE